MADYGVSTTNPYAMLGDGDSTPKVLSKDKGAQKQKEQTVAKTARAAKKDDSGRGGRRRPKREFDRRSGTGRGKENPKGGHGRGGWGRTGEFDEERKDRRRNNRRGPRREQEGEQKTETTEETTEKTETPAEEVPEEEEDNSMTYEEYLKKKQENAVDGDRVQRRGVSNDNDTFKAHEVEKVAVSCEEEQLYSMGSGLKNRRVKSKANKNTVYTFDDLVNNRRGRGGQRGGRGGRGGQRGGRGGRRVDVDDKRAFPALGGK